MKFLTKKELCYYLTPQTLPVKIEYAVPVKCFMLAIFAVCHVFQALNSMTCIILYSQPTCDQYLSCIFSRYFVLYVLVIAYTACIFTAF